MGERRTGFVLIDGDARRAPAKPRHWLMCVAIVIVASWVLDAVYLLVSQGLRFADQTQGLTAMFAQDWRHAAFPEVAGCGAMAVIAVLLSARLDQRNARSLGLTPQAAVSLPLWFLAGALISAPALVFLFDLIGEWRQVAATALIVLVPMVLIQAGSEEILFRGILLPCLGARYGAALGVLISAIIFALWHAYLGQSAPDFITRVGGAFVFGLTAGLLALHQGHLGGAIGLHVAWNVVWSLQTGFLDWPSPFWDSYLLNQFMEVDWEYLRSESMLQEFLVPLTLETLLVAGVCRETAIRLLAARR